MNLGENRIPGLAYPVLTANSTTYIDDSFLDDYVTILALDSSFPGPGRDILLKESAIVRAQIYIESLLYVGMKHYAGQILQWPRYPVYDKDGLLIDSKGTPYSIFNAVAEASFLEYYNNGILQGEKTNEEIYPLSSTAANATDASTSKSFDTRGGRGKTQAEKFQRLQGYLANYLFSETQISRIART